MEVLMGLLVVLAFSAVLVGCGLVGALLAHIWICIFDQKYVDPSKVRHCGDIRDDG